jgi:hypothetical protein
MLPSEQPFSPDRLPVNLKAGIVPTLDALIFMRNSGRRAIWPGSFSMSGAAGRQKLPHFARR